MCHFADNFFKCFFLNENDGILSQVSLKFNNKSALVQIMAQCQIGNKTLPVFALKFRNLPAQNSSLKIFKHEKEEKFAGPKGKLAGPAQFLVAEGLGPALNAKTVITWKQWWPGWFTVIWGICNIISRAHTRHFEIGVLDTYGAHCKHNY